MIPQSEFNKALKVASLFAGPDKPGLHVVHFNFYNTDNFELVATDGHKLVIINISVAHTVPLSSSRFSIPLPMVEEFLKKFPAQSDTEVTIVHWEGQLMVTNGATTHMVRGADPEGYVEYRNIVQQSAPSPDEVYLNPRLLEGIVKDCGPLLPKSKKDDWPIARLITNGAKFPVSLRFQLGEDLETINQLDAYLMPCTPIDL